MKRLLLATDLSPRSELALARAWQLKRQHGAKLHICHVVDNALPEHLAEAQKLAARSILQERIRSFGGDAAASISVAVVIGKPYAAILHEAIEAASELIVLGVHRGGADGLHLGSTAERVIREGHHPVLVVRRDASAGYQQAVVGVDFSLHSLWAARTGFQLAPQAEFHLVHSYVAPTSAFFANYVRAQARDLHVRQLNQAIEGELAAFLARLGDRLPMHKRLVVEGSASDVLLDLAGRLQADLLIAGTHGRTGVAHALLGSVAEDLLLQAHCDVLVAKAW
jgi:nucleotide-binding universal stress UspA family protein